MGYRQALAAIAGEIDAIAGRLARRGMRTRKVASRDLGDTKLLIEGADSQVKVEVNAVFRGTVLPVERRGLTPGTADLFGAELELPVLATAELYGSKLVAAMDRQHPRDPFDAWQMFASGGLSDATVECFVTYLAAHNRPTHEVLFGNDKDIADEYRNTFVGMTADPVSFETLLETRALARGTAATADRRAASFGVWAARAVSQPRAAVSGFMGRIIPAALAQPGPAQSACRPAPVRHQFQSVAGRQALLGHDRDPSGNRAELLVSLN